GSGAGGGAALDQRHPGDGRARRRRAAGGARRLFALRTVAPHGGQRPRGGKMRTLILLLLLPQTASARVPDWWRRVGWVDADSQRGDADQMTRLATRGAVKLRLHLLSGDVEVVQ